MKERMSADKRGVGGARIRRKQERGRETSKDKCFPYKRVSRASDQTSSSVNSFLRSCQQESPPPSSVCCFVYQSAPIVLRGHWSNDSYLPTPPPDTESQNTSDYLLPHQHYHLVRPFFLPPAHSVLLFMCFKSSSLQTSSSSSSSSFHCHKLLRKTLQKQRPTFYFPIWWACFPVQELIMFQPQHKFN